MALNVIRFVAFYCLLHSSVYAEQHAAEEFTAEQAKNYLKMPDVTSQQGKFVQYKHFKVLKKPFVSEGKYQVTTEGFEWTTLKPVHSSLVFDGNSLWQVSSNGKQEKLPITGTFTEIIKALIVVDFDTLERLFSIAKAKRDACLILKPKDATMAAVAETVELCYQHQELSLRLDEDNGNYTRLEIQQTPLAPTTN